MFAKYCHIVRAVLLLIMVNLSCVLCYAQQDTEFWFAAPYFNCIHGQDSPYRLIVFSFEEEATVTISMPANPDFEPIVTHIASNSFANIELAANKTAGDARITTPFNQVSNRGLFIASTSRVECYYQVEGANSEAFTLKGRNALGTDFLVVGQKRFNNGAYGEFEGARCSVHIVASEDNTEVQIIPSGPMLLADGSSSSAPVTVLLNKGETYAVASYDEAGANNLVGSTIRANHPIAVTVNDDSLMPNSCADDVGEQLLPVDFAGTDFVVVSSGNELDYCTVFALQDNTSVTASTGDSFTINKGEHRMISMAGIEAVYIEASLPVMVFQVLTPSRNSGEFGGSIVPHVECTGSSVAGYKSFSDNYDIYFNLITPKANIEHFTINGTPISASSFRPVGTSDAYYYARIRETPSATPYVVRCSSGIFQMGVTEGNEADSNTYGFFSDYAEQVPIIVEVNGVVVESFYHANPSESVTLYAHPASGFDLTDIVWTLPDGTTMTGERVELGELKAEWSGDYVVMGQTSQCGMRRQEFRVVATGLEADCFPMEGTAFHVAFMGNEAEPHSVLKIAAASREGAVVTVTNPRTGWSDQMTVSAGGAGEIVVPNEQARPAANEQAVDNGLYVTATSPVTLFASNASEPSPRTWDVTTVLPADNLGSRYMVQTLPAGALTAAEETDLTVTTEEDLTVTTEEEPGEAEEEEAENETVDKAEFVILATEDNTVVDISLTDASAGGHLPGEAYQVTLQAGETYLVTGATVRTDFSGTTIDAHGKKIAVFNGTTRACLPAGTEGSDHLYEQALPIERLGKAFVVIASVDRRSDWVKITATEDNTEVYLDGVVAATLNAGKSYTFKIEEPQTSCYVEASAPVVAALYLTGYAANGSLTRTGDPAMVTLMPVEHATQYTTITTLSTSQSCAHYANIVTATAQVDGMHLDGLEIASFFAPVPGNETYSFARLPLSEGAHTFYSSSGSFTGHIYGVADEEAYACSMGAIICVSNGSGGGGGGGGGGSSVTRHTICEGETFDWNGLSLTRAGRYETYVTSQTTGLEDSLCVLILSVLPKTYARTVQTICSGESYTWMDRTYTSSIRDTVVLTNAAGCDSVCTLDLTVHYCCPEPEQNVQQLDICDTLLPFTWTTWREHLLDHDGLYLDTIKGYQNCDSIVYLLDFRTHHCCAPMAGEVAAEDICADEASLDITVALTQGEVSEWEVRFFNPAANTMPFRDTLISMASLDASASPMVISLPVPADEMDTTRYPRPDDTYRVSLTARDICGNERTWADIPFGVLYPSWVIEQHWDDVIAVLNERYNGGYVFTKVEWLRDGELLPGEREPYIYLPHELWTNPEHTYQAYLYQARLTRADDNKAILTCPIEPSPVDNTNVLEKSYVDVRPTLVPMDNPVVHVMTNTSGIYWVYSADGKLLQTASYDTCEHKVFDIPLYDTRAMYILLFAPADTQAPLKDKYRAIKVFVL